jgi:hypothetical protein
MTKRQLKLNELNEEMEYLMDQTPEIMEYLSFGAEYDRIKDLSDEEYNEEVGEEND